MRKSILPTLLFLGCLSPLIAGPEKTLIFSDDFNRNESQEITDELGGDWTTSSGTRAGGNKQVDLKNGAMYIYIHETADHAVSVRHPIGFRDGSVELRFMLENADDSLGLNFADMDYKKVWAGHLFMVRISTENVQINDLKTGTMDLTIRNLRKENELSDEQQAMLKTKSRDFPNKLETSKWYDLKVRVDGDKVNVAINGSKVATFSSEGFAHPNKGLLRLSVAKKAVVDDLKFYSNDK